MLVLDTEKTLEFFEVLETIGSSHSVKVLRFVTEILENAKALEQRILRMERESKAVIKDEAVEEDFYEDEEESDEAQGSVLG